MKKIKFGRRRKKIGFPTLINFLAQEVNSINFSSTTKSLIRLNHAQLKRWHSVHVRCYCYAGYAVGWGIDEFYGNDEEIIQIDENRIKSTSENQWYHNEVCIDNVDANRALTMAMRNSLHLTISLEIDFNANCTNMSCWMDDTVYSRLFADFFFSSFFAFENSPLTFQSNNPPDNHCYALTIVDRNFFSYVAKWLDRKLFAVLDNIHLWIKFPKM